MPRHCIETAFLSAVTLTVHPSLPGGIQAVRTGPLDIPGEGIPPVVEEGPVAGDNQEVVFAVAPAPVVDNLGL